MYYVYLLKCEDGLIYTGFTSNITERLRKHQEGLVFWTKTRLPVELISFCAFKDKYKALAFEKYLKSGSGKAFSKKRLIS